MAVSTINLPHFIARNDTKNICSPYLESIFRLPASVYLTSWHAENEAMDQPFHYSLETPEYLFVLFHLPFDSRLDPPVPHPYFGIFQLAPITSPCSFDWKQSRAFSDSESANLSSKSLESHARYTHSRSFWRILFGLDLLFHGTFHSGELSHWVARLRWCPIARLEESKELG